MNKQRSYLVYSTDGSLNRKVFINTKRWRPSKTWCDHWGKEPVIEGRGLIGPIKYDQTRTILRKGSSN